MGLAKRNRPNDAMEIVEIIGLIGSVGSILGFAGTLWAFFQQHALRKRYTLLLRGPELLEHLMSQAATLNELLPDVPANTRQILLELPKTRSIVESLTGKVNRVLEQKLRMLADIIEKQQPNLSAKGIHYVYRSIHEIILDVQNHIEDLRSGA